MLCINDQIGNELNFEKYPLRIVSLVPSQSELLWDLNLNNEIVGVTKFCIHPKELRAQKTIVGGTKNLKCKCILDLNPDLIIGNLEENTKEEIEFLQNRIPTYISDVVDIKSAIQMISDLGKICNRAIESQKIIQQIQSDYREDKPKLPLKKALYLIWNEPLMSIGGDTFISKMMPYAGYENVMKNYNRYPVITDDEIKKLQMDEILLSSEPYPFAEKHLGEFQERFPKTKIRLVNGEFFSWYGSRLLKSKDYFNQLCDERNQ